MPRAYTLADVVPVLWNGLHMGECERIRTFTRAGFDRLMDKHEMALTAKVRDRLWNGLVSKGLAVKSSCTYNALDLDAFEFRNFILDEGLEDKIDDLGSYRPEDTYTHIHDTHTTHIGEGAQ